MPGGRPITHAHAEELAGGLTRSPAAAVRGGWETVDLTRPERRATALEACRAIAARAGGGSLHSDPDWLLGHDAARAPMVRLLMLRDGPLAGYAALLVKPRRLRFQLGELTLFAPRLRYHSLSGEPLLARDDGALPGEDERREACTRLLAALRAQLGPGDALALEGIPEEGPLACLAATGAEPGFLATRLGAPFDRQLIAMPADWAAYEQALGTRSRKSLRYSRRKLSEHLDGALAVRCFTRPADVEAYLADAVRISRKTYQWNLLGLGLRDGDALRERLDFAAERGWLRCYVLYGRDQPLAFMHGILHGDTYYYLDVGYDPEWARWSVGSVLQVEVLQDLFALPQPPRWFDFSTGYGTHKARFGNRSRREANWLLLPRGLRSAALLGAHRATERLSARLAAFLERHDLKTRLKKLLRGRAAAAGGPEAAA